MTQSVHVQAIVNAGKEALRAIDSDLVQLDEQRRVLLSEKRKLTGLIKSYTAEVAPTPAPTPDPTPAPDPTPNKAPSIKTGDAVQA